MKLTMKHLVLLFGALIGTQVYANKVTLKNDTNETVHVQINTDSGKDKYFSVEPGTANSESTGLLMRGIWVWTGNAKDYTEAYNPIFYVFNNEIGHKKLRVNKDALGVLVVTKD